MKTITATNIENKWFFTTIIKGTYKTEEEVLSYIHKENLKVFRNFGGKIYARDERAILKPIEKQTEEELFSIEQEKAIRANGDDKIDDLN